jgi:hypothetical protein
MSASAMCDGPLRQHLLQLAHGHQAPVEDEEAEQRFDHQRDQYVLRLIRIAVELGRAYGRLCSEGLPVWQRLAAIGLAGARPERYNIDQNHYFNDCHRQK